MSLLCEYNIVNGDRYISNRRIGYNEKRHWVNLTHLMSLVLVPKILTLQI